MLKNVFKNSTMDFGIGFNEKEEHKNQTNGFFEFEEN